MGGVIIILATLIPCLLLARLDNVYIILMIVVTLMDGRQLDLPMITLRYFVKISRVCVANLRLSDR